MAPQQGNLSNKQGNSHNELNRIQDEYIHLSALLQEGDNTNLVRVLCIISIIIYSTKHRGRCLIYRCGHVTSWVLDLTLVSDIFILKLFSLPVEKVLTKQLNGFNQELIQSILHAQAEWCLYRIFDMVSPSLSSLPPSPLSLPLLSPSLSSLPLLSSQFFAK